MYRKFTRYRFPRFIRKQTLGSVTEKISKKLHVSKRKSSEYIQIVSLLMDDKLAEKFSFEENDMEIMDQMKKTLFPMKR